MRKNKITGIAAWSTLTKIFPGLFSFFWLVYYFPSPLLISVRVTVVCRNTLFHPPFFSSVGAAEMAENIFPCQEAANVKTYSFPIYLCIWRSLYISWLFSVLFLNFDWVLFFVSCRPGTPAGGAEEACQRSKDKITDSSKCSRIACQHPKASQEAPASASCFSHSPEFLCLNPAAPVHSSFTHYHCTHGTTILCQQHSYGNHKPGL